MQIIINRLLLFLCWLTLPACGHRDQDTVTDADGHVYPVVRIGQQVWMAENLAVTHYRNGDPITHVPADDAWATAREGAYSLPPQPDEPYGALYNWHAVQDARGLAPAGWHLPTEAEINALIDHLQGDTLAGGALKSIGLDHWLHPNKGATNSSGFAALPGGYRLGSTGSFHTQGSNGYWWHTMGSYELFAWSDRLFIAFAHIARDTQYVRYGFAVRCIKD